MTNSLLGGAATGGTAAAGGLLLGPIGLAIGEYSRGAIAILYPTPPSIATFRLIQLCLFSDFIYLWLSIIQCHSNSLIYIVLIV